jgi:hypothetical protein
MSQANQNVLCSAVVKAAGLLPDTTGHLGYRLTALNAYNLVLVG